MRTPARYWVVVFAFAAALCACAGRGITPIPFAPPVGPAAVSDDASAPDDTPDLRRRCATERLQGGWVFRGACKAIAVPRKGTTARLPLRNNFALSVHLPRNDATTGQRIVIADAIPTTILPHAGHPFPQFKNAFFYFKTTNRERIVRFRNSTRVKFVIASAGAAFHGPCTIARLVHGVWKTIPVAGSVSGTTVQYLVPEAKFAAIPHGVAYLGFECHSAPSPSPSPTVSPTTKPTTPPTPAYCAKYSVPATNTVQINVDDNSRLRGAVILYVRNGTAWMNDAGAFASSSANPIPLVCFPGSAGEKGRHFALPPNVAAARLYISYAPSTGTTTAPNPLASMAASGPPQSFGGQYWSVPWDVVELGTTSGAVIDLTAVTSLGLPMEMQQGPPGKTPADAVEAAPQTGIGPRAIPLPCPTSGAGIVGVTSCNYANIYTAMSSLPQYQNLVATGKFNGKTIDLRIINPSKAQGAWNFGNDWFYNPVYIGSYPPQCTGVPTPLANGYLSCVLAAYASTSHLYATAGSGVKGVSGANYCVSSDGSANFGFTNVQSAKSCKHITYKSPNTFAMPIALFKYGTPPTSKDGAGCDAGFLFGLPPNNNWIGKGHGKKNRHANVFATADAFAVWKGLALDLNRGAALSNASHPAGGWAQNFASPVPFTDYYDDPLYNAYAYVLHYYYDHHQSYALSYDEPGGQASAFKYVTGNAIYLTVNPVPTAAAVSPVSSPVPYPTPSPCTTFPTNVGG
jgi:hypothetical protein